MPREEQSETSPGMREGSLRDYSIPRKCACSGGGFAHVGSGASGCAAAGAGPDPRASAGRACRGDGVPSGHRVPRTGLGLALLTPSHV